VLPRGERAACEAFAAAFCEVASGAPLDLDGVVYWGRVFGGS
jgi:hypothetical protein